MYAPQWCLSLHIDNPLHIMIHDLQSLSSSLSAAALFIGLPLGTLLVLFVTGVLPNPFEVPSFLLHSSSTVPLWSVWAHFLVIGLTVLCWCRQVCIQGGTTC